MKGAPVCGACFYTDLQLYLSLLCIMVLLSGQPLGSWESHTTIG